MDDRLECKEAVAGTWAPQHEILDATAAGIALKKNDVCPIHLVTLFNHVHVWDHLWKIIR